MSKHAHKIDCNKKYPVAYLAPHQSVTGQYEYSPDGFELYGRDLTSNQIDDIFYAKEDIEKIRKQLNQEQ